MVHSLILLAERNSHQCTQQFIVWLLAEHKHYQAVIGVMEETVMVLDYFRATAISKKLSTQLVRFFMKQADYSCWYPYKNSAFLHISFQKNSILLELWISSCCNPSHLIKLTMLYLNGSIISGVNESLTNNGKLPDSVSVVKSVQSLAEKGTSPLGETDLIFILKMHHIPNLHAYFTYTSTFF